MKIEEPIHSSGENIKAVNENTSGEFVPRRDSYPSKKLEGNATEVAESWHHSMHTAGKEILLRMPKGERPDSRSSMGRFIQNIIEHKQVRNDNQPQIMIAPQIEQIIPNDHKSVIIRN